MLELVNNTGKTHYDTTTHKFEQTPDDYMLTCYKHPDIEVIDYALLEKLIDYISDCQQYDKSKGFIQILKENNENMFEYFLKNKSDKYTEINSDVDATEFIHSYDKFKSIQQSGFYSGNIFDIFLTNEFGYRMNAETFGAWYAQQRLGCSYLTNKCINKDLLPFGIGIVTKFVTFDNVTYEFIIKISLIELESDTSKVTYVQDQSVIKVEILKY